MTEMKWVSASTRRPSRNGFYYCWHPIWGRVAMGYINGWGPSAPDYWLEGDEMPADLSSCGDAEVLTK